MAEEIQVVEATARPLPAERAPGTIELWGREVGPLAAAAGAGAAAGVAAVAVARAASARAPRPAPRALPAAREDRRAAARSWSTSTSSGASRDDADEGAEASARRLFSRDDVVEVEVRPAFPVKLPRGGGDGVARVREGVLERLLHVEPCPIRVRAWQARTGIRIRAERIEPRLAIHFDELRDASEAGREQLELADRRGCASCSPSTTTWARSSGRSRRDPLIGAAIHRKPWIRPKRRPWPWEALAWAITEQLIESSRAAAIQRRMVRRWGPRVAPARRSDRPLMDVPSPAVIAGRAPAELVSMDLTEARAVAMVRCAREVAEGRADLARPGVGPPPAGDPRDRAVDPAVRRAAAAAATRTRCRRATSST